MVAEMRYTTPAALRITPPSRQRSIPSVPPPLPPFRPYIFKIPKPSSFQASKLTTSLKPTADFVQELYLKELKAYKPTPVKDSDALGQVATFSEPKAPKSPEEADLASNLKEYESMAVEVEGQEGAEAGKPVAAVEDWLVEEDEEEAAAH